jgi:rhamnogalacturonyl hydrolase YesR
MSNVPAALLALATRAPYLRESFVVRPAMTDAFVHDEPARAMARTNAVYLHTARGVYAYRYYVTEPVVADDYKGVGRFILAAHELGR